MTTYPDLVTPNQHLTSCSSFFKNFVSSIEFLLYVGCNRPCPSEYEHSGFSTKGTNSWKPWHHVYSNCKITKGEHYPMYNPAGKYVIRLFWMGTWRKIYVDDFVPVDHFDNLLLPTLVAPKLIAEQSLEELVGKPVKAKIKEKNLPRKNTIELWPMILCKALLKLASLSSPSNDFDIINCLTGWVPQKLQIKDLSLWDVFMAQVKRFEWDNAGEGNTKKSENTKHKSKVEEDPAFKGSKAANPLGMKDRFVVLSCINTENLTQNDENPANKFVFLSEIRDIPLIKPLPSPELEFWKKFRYEKWAVEQGIIPPDIKKLNIKSLKIVDPFERINNIKKNLANDNNYMIQDTDFIDRKSEKSVKTSKKSSRATTKTSILEPDPSEWIDLVDIQNSIAHLVVYFQPSSFISKTKISDILFAFKTTDFSHVVWPYSPKQTKNEPLYLFTDSIDDKFLLISLAQMGDVAMLKKMTKDEKSLSDIIESESLDICEEILMKKTFLEEASSSDEQSVQVEENLNSSNKNHSISVVFEEYNWESNSVGRFITSINTLGSKSIILEMKPGRYSFKIWLTSHCPYVLQIFSDKLLTIGSLEDYLTACSKESQLLINLCQELFSCFGKLVQSFGTPDHSQCLKNLYRCYKPQQSLSKKELSVTHKIFFEEFCETAANCSLVQDPVKALKLLFLQLKTFDYIKPSELHLDPQKLKLFVQIDYAKKMQKAAVKIQAFFKRIYIRAMLRKFEGNHKDNLAIFGNLKKIYQEIFSNDKQLTYLNLFRKIFDRSEMVPFRDKFEIFQDMRSVLDLQIFNGILIPQEPTWIPICRYDFNINFNNPITMKVALFSNLKSQTVKVFNNDNKDEVKQLFGNVLVEKYSANKSGYTVVAYGFPPDADKINWQIIFATRKIYRDDLSITTIPLATLSLKDQYIPNFNNIICRYNIKVGADAYLTASLTTSHSDVKICLRLLNKNEKLIRELCGIRNVVFPLVELQFSEPQPNQVKEKSVDFSKISSIYADTAKITKRHKINRSTISLDDTNATRSDSEPKLSIKKSQSIKGSRASLLGRSNKNSHSSIRDFAHTLYILEAKVVDDSWPLTGDEWNRVQKAREKNYINYFASRSQKKLKKSLSLTLEEPYWTLDLQYAANSVLEFKQDASKTEQRKSMKMKWFEDPERFKRGTELRDAYLQDHLKPKSSPFIDKYIRSNNKEDFALQVITDEPLDDYMTKPLREVDLDFCKTKNEDDYVIDEANRERQFKEYQIEEQAMQDDIEGILQEQMEDFEVLSKWFKEIRNDSERALEMERNLLRENCTDGSRKISKGDKKGKEEKKK